MNHKPKNCIQCHAIPQNLFFLSCTHPLCLICAKNLTQFFTNNQYSIICPGCQDQTTLTHQLYIELNQQEEKLVKHAKIKKNNDNKQNQAFSVATDLKLQKYLLQKDQEPFERYCSDHSQFAVLYVCKNCDNRLICPQCAINGLHKKHEVVGIQKQGEKIKQKVHKQLGTLNSKITELKHLQFTRLATISERINQLQRLKNVAKEQYNQIRSSLDQQEKVVVSKCNQLILIHTQQESNFKEQINKQLTNYQKTRSNIITLLNPFVKESILDTNKLFQKMCYINLIAQYNNCRVQQHIQTQNSNQCYNDQEITNNFKNIVQRIEKFKVENVKENIYEQFGTKPLNTSLKLQGLYKNQRLRNDRCQLIKSQYKSYIPKKNDYFHLL